MYRVNIQNDQTGSNCSYTFSTLEVARREAQLAVNNDRMIRVIDVQTGRTLEIY